MFKCHGILGLYAERPLHPGAGNSSGPIDLIIQREATTDLPTVEGKSLKGVVRDCARRLWRDPSKLYEVFGPEIGDETGGHSGAASFGDARLLLYPVRAEGHVFVWLTSPFVLNRLARDLHALELDAPPLPPDGGEAGLSVGRIGPGLLRLGDETVEVKVPPDVELWNCWREFIQGRVPSSPGYEYFRDRIGSHLVLVPDRLLAKLTRSEIEVVTRIHLNSKKTTTGGLGNMWREELVPAESLFYSPVSAADSSRPAEEGQVARAARTVADELRVLLTNQPVRVGGSETVGRGSVRTTWYESQPAHTEETDATDHTGTDGAA